MRRMALHSALSLISTIDAVPPRFRTTELSSFSPSLWPIPPLLSIGALLELSSFSLNFQPPVFLWSQRERFLNTTCGNVVDDEELADDGADDEGENFWGLGTPFFRKKHAPLAIAKPAGQVKANSPTKMKRAPGGKRGRQRRR
jgi:hypothetical protein